MVWHRDITPKSPIETALDVANTAYDTASRQQTGNIGGVSIPNTNGTKTLAGSVAGAAGVAQWVGDTVAPGRPIGLTASSVAGSVTVNWDGTLEGGVPADFSHIEISGTDAAGHSYDFGSLMRSGSQSIADMTGGTVITIVATALDGAHDLQGGSAPNRSDLSAPITVTVASAVDASVVQAAQDKAQQALDKAGAADDKATSAAKDASGAKADAANANTVAGAAKSSAATAVSTANNALTVAGQAKDDTVTGNTTAWGVSASPTTVPASWSSTAPSWSAGCYIWARTTVTYGDGHASVADPIVITGNPGANGAKGDRGPAGAAGASGTNGVGVTEIARYYTLALSAPSQPADNTDPADGWSLTEPAYRRDYDLYTIDKVSYSNGRWSWTKVQLSSTYAVSSSALTAAESAKQTADNAATTASTASTAASGAQSAASKASSVATQAQATAASANQAATDAQNAANQVAQTAGSASTAAQAAQRAADLAQQTAQTAQTNAANAAAVANTAQAVAQGAKTTADGRNKIFESIDEPNYANLVPGDLWFQTNATVGNLVMNGGFETGDAAGWHLQPEAQVKAITNANSGKCALLIQTSGSGRGTGFQGLSAQSSTIKLVKGHTYHVSFAAYLSSRGYIDSSITVNGYVDDFADTSARTTGDYAWREYHYDFTIPENLPDNNYMSFDIRFHPQGLLNASYNQWVDDVSIVDTDAHVIGIKVWNGTGWADMVLMANQLLVASSVGTTEIADNAVITGKIGANAVTTLQLAAQSVTADKVNVGNLTAAIVKSGKFVTADGLTGFDSNGFWVKDKSGNELFAANANGVQATGGFRTATSGNRIEIRQGNYSVGGVTYNTGNIGGYHGSGPGEQSTWSINGATDSNGSTMMGIGVGQQNAISIRDTNELDLASANIMGSAKSISLNGRSGQRAFIGDATDSKSIIELDADHVQANGSPIAVGTNFEFLNVRGHVTTNLGVINGSWTAHKTKPSAVVVTAYAQPNELLARVFRPVIWEYGDTGYQVRFVDERNQQWTGTQTQMSFDLVAIWL